MNHVNVAELSDKELLDKLERLIAERGVMLRTCRSGVKIELGFRGYGATYTFFGGEHSGKLNQGVGEYSDEFTEQAFTGEGPGLDCCGGNLRALLRKAISNDQDLKRK